jgi:hypothetical protein
MCLVLTFLLLVVGNVACTSCCCSSCLFVCYINLLLHYHKLGFYFQVQNSFVAMRPLSLGHHRKVQKLYRLPNIEMFSPHIQVPIFSHLERFQLPRDNAGQSIWDKSEVLLRTHWGTYRVMGNIVENPLWTWWEHIVNQNTPKNPTLLPPLTEDKIWSLGVCCNSLLAWVETSSVHWNCCWRQAVENFVWLHWFCVSILKKCSELLGNRKMAAAVEDKISSMDMCCCGVVELWIHNNLCESATGPKHNAIWLVLALLTRYNNL